MSVFASAEPATTAFRRLFQELSEQQTFTDGLRAGGLTLLFDHTDPQCRILVSPDGVRTGDDATTATVSHTFKMTCDTAHSLWLGKIPFAGAVNAAQLRIFGSVAKVIEVMILLEPAFERYPKIVAELGIES
ncbi:MAG TPA: hypothetical protein VEK80_19280 [Kribbellaceae bacterium]|nr:hypothetical protein [Kribbellaceae bacterium]